MINHLIEATKNPWIGIYLKILALIFTYSCLVHVANIAGFGEKPWLETPLTWQIGDVVYGILDFAVVIGLWQGKAWGIVCFLVAILSQFFIYTVFLDAFTLTPEHRQTIYSLLGTEAILLLVFVALLMFKN